MTTGRLLLAGVAAWSAVTCSSLAAGGAVAYEGVVTCVDTNRHLMTVYGGNVVSRQKSKLPAHVTFHLRLNPDVKKSDKTSAGLGAIQWGSKVNLTYSKQSADRYVAKTIRLIGADPGFARQVADEADFRGKPMPTNTVTVSKRRFLFW